ncbi:hypothetical protein GOODEAATRI_000463 [Goodea atripinnis]|uniref:Uncharacterized protein n=1 Tax=Goodea atripinnis TaxID=208336 RepID=A0ABV0PA78_9TELE
MRNALNTTQIRRKRDEFSVMKTEWLTETFSCCFPDPGRLAQASCELTLVGPEGMTRSKGRASVYTFSHLGNVFTV